MIMDAMERPMQFVARDEQAHYPCRRHTGRSAGVGPVPHDGKTVEQRNLMLLGDDAHVVA